MLRTYKETRRKRREGLRRSRRTAALRLEKLEPRALLTTGLVISEFAADNSLGLEDEDGDAPDWIELHNTTNAPLSLDGYHLTDNSTDLNKWSFPDVDVAGGGYLVVFASNKDRTDPTANLHSNFKLSASGEFLALTRDIPDPNNPGSITQEVVHGYTPTYPQQTTDITFGIPTEAIQAVLVDTASSVDYFVPSDNSLGDSWTETNFAVDASWTSATSPVGYDLNGGAQVVIADSQADWSTSGTQGENNWYYGYHNATADANNNYEPGEFISFPRDGGGHSTTDYWDGTQWDWFAGNPPYTMLGQTAVHPNGSNNTNMHWPIRRWQSTISGDITVNFTVAKSNPNGGGVTGEIWFNGQREFTQAIAGNDTTGFTQAVTITGVNVGDYIDLAVLPDDLNGGTGDNSDGSIMYATIEGSPTLTPLVTTDISADMDGVNSAAYLRYPFQVANASAYEQLTLNIQHDSGFVAWLNGVEVAGDNAPAAVDVLFDSTGRIRACRSRCVADSILRSHRRLESTTKWRQRAGDPDLEFFCVRRRLAGSPRTCRHFTFLRSQRSEVLPHPHTRAIQRAGHR